MPAPTTKGAASLVLICGDDELAVKQRAKTLFQQWTAELGGLDHEVIDGAVSHSGEGLKALARVRESLQTLPFFGRAKVVWLRDCNLLADDRVASSQAITENLASLAQELKSFDWSGVGQVRLLISAGKVDKRKVFFKTLDKLGTIETLAGWSADDRDWSDRAELWARGALRQRHKEISDAALADLVSRVGPNPRQLDSEVEKLSLYVGPRAHIEIEDVGAICTRNKSARAFALGDALGDRDLPRLLRRLDEALWEARLDPQQSEIGLLYGLIAKVRALLLLQEMAREGWVKQDSDYNRFKAQLQRVPPDRLPQDKRFNPLALNPYVLFKALPQITRYSTAELVRAMELFLQCNRRLVSSGLDAGLLMQQTLVQIVSPSKGPAPLPVSGT